MGDIVRADANDRDNIWLRQSVTFTVDGQTRTLEVGIPLPPGATADEVEALLNEADVGMAHLSRYLDARVAAQLGLPAPQEPVVLPGRTIGEQASTPPPASEPRPAPVEAEEDLPAPPPANDAPARQPATSQESASSPTPTRAAPTTSPAAPARPAPARSEPRPAAAAPRTPAPSMPIAAGPDMTRPQFITALGELGLNPKQAMDRLNVRSLEGLNLREALEALRRQLLQEAPGSPEPDLDPAPAVAESHAEPEPNIPAAAARYFDEEDDPNLVFTVDEPGFEDEEEFGAVEAAAESEPPDDEDDLDLEDVPDFPAPPLSAPPAAASRTPRKAAPARTPAPDVEPTDTAALQSASGPERARAMQLVGKLRSAQGGGPASDYQRKAYRNLVVGQLDADQAAALVRGLWRIPAERLTSDQLDALIRWGKEDAFVDEAALVLATLRGEQARAAAANGARAEQAPTPPAQRPRPARGAGTSSARQGGAR